MIGRGASLVERVADGLRPLYARVFTRATILEGAPAHGGPSMRCLLVGSSDFTRYLEARIYAGPATVRWRRRLSLIAARSLVDAVGSEVDLCVADVPAHAAARFGSGADLRTDAMLFQQIDLESEWFLARSTPPGASAKARAAGFTSASSTDPADLRFFYDAMYLPHARAQFGALAIVSPFSKLEKLLGQGWLQFVNAGGQRVVGDLVTVVNGMATSTHVGVLGGDRRHVEAGAIAADYAFLIDAVRERGCRHLGLESSRPLLDDGAFSFKRKWGAGVRRAERAVSTVSIRFGNRTPEFVAPFLARHPLVTTGPEGLTAVVGAPASQVGSRAERQIRNRSYSPGLVALTVVTGRLEDARTVRY